MKSAGKARNNGLYRHIRTSKEIIRNLLNDYDKAYEAMVTMAKTNRHWILIRRNTILWAKDQCVVWKLRSAIENRLNNCAVDCNRENFTKALDEIKNIVGY